MIILHRQLYCLGKPWSVFSSRGKLTSATSIHQSRTSFITPKAQLQTVTLYRAIEELQLKSPQIVWYCCWKATTFYFIQNYSLSCWHWQSVRLHEMQLSYCCKMSYTSAFNLVNEPLNDWGDNSLCRLTLYPMVHLICTIPTHVSINYTHLEAVLTLSPQYLPFWPVAHLHWWV